MTLLTSQRLHAFICFLNFFTVFAVWGGLIDISAFIITLILITGYTFLHFSKKGVGLIFLSLGLLMVITIFTIIAGNDFVATSDIPLINDSITINGTTSTFGTSGNIVYFFIDPTQGAIILITTIFIIGAVIGIQILGSGLNEASSRAFMYGIFYIGIWVILSVPSYPLIIGISLFGAIIYSVLTLFYAIGVIQRYLK